jgi:two-component system, OmpR family, phosphate regulon sensor histidine kinase PhoR
MMETILGLSASFILLLFVSAWLFKRRGDVALRHLQVSRHERNLARDELTQSREQWDAIRQTINEGIVVIDGNRRIVSMNVSSESLLNFHNGVGRSFDEVAWGLQLQPLVVEVLARRAESLAQIAVKDERTFQISVRVCPVDGQLGALIVLAEITELQRLGRVRRDFVANISHELRTPVTSLGIIADTLANELDSTSPALIWLTKLRGQIDVLNQLTSELMDLTLIESGQMPIKLVETSVAELVSETAELFRPQAERKEIELQIETEPMLRALTDPVGARRVLSNLLHNAIKFTGRRGRIIVRANGVGDNVELQVEDTGIGIPTEDLPRIFERFYKVDRARVQGESRSTGLGLAIARHIVEAHGGNIWASSQEGKGSIFHFTLPSAN